ncbi:uncharacterized protein [Bemisia tabaci]|uniref:uncharacterized protein n=1 Tax=Bemisia tabaci TaxID=7038 RepID=UPI003B287EA4
MMLKLFAFAAVLNAFIQTVDGAAGGFNATVKVALPKAPAPVEFYVPGNVPCYNMPSPRYQDQIREIIGITCVRAYHMLDCKGKQVPVPAGKGYSWKADRKDIPNSLGVC